MKWESVVLIAAATCAANAQPVQWRVQDGGNGHGMSDWNSYNGTGTNAGAQQLPWEPTSYR